ncbi:M23 family metallopeptidase [Sphingomicrobium sediminis]|uniref:M23 family metallopeptidase n=1 Tax=Sphingomicrobium sediminis TaxID=2950949 RepID=A0A9X2EJ52_9SPHN|nr:M23 family metallopeptidase [Sphingomicrobium sediminis]MCM8558426.1 M23 family metallopeptidase [Sphingomicrobium sediminis]
MISILALAGSIAVSDQPVYRIDMPGPGDYESWVVDHQYSAELGGPVQIIAEGANGAKVVQEWPDISMLDSNVDGRFTYVAHYPKSLEVRSFTISVGDIGVRYEPIAFEQQGSYILPLAGNAIISNGVFNNNGHGWIRSRFAYDFLGLSDTYGPMTDPEYRNENLAGFGMDVIAPADGKVVFIEDRVPDQVGGYDSATFTFPDGSQAYHGNNVIIDHGNGEFTSLMHLKFGSVVVAVGDTVVQGHKVGELGNSGDSYGPHLHVQLQHCGEPQACPSLPLTFANHGDEILEAGDFITYRPLPSE